MSPLRIKKNIKRALVNGEKITQVDARRFGVSVISRYIYELRNDGLKIKSKPLNNSKYLVYYIE